MSEKTSSNQTLMAVLCYFGILVIIPLLTEDKKDPFVKFHIKQGLVLLIAYVIAGFVSWIPLINGLVWLALFILFIMGIVNAATGKKTELPVIGSLGSKFNI